MQYSEATTENQNNRPVLADSPFYALGGRREPGKKKKRLAGPHRQGREVGARLWLGGKIRRQLREGTRLSSSTHSCHGPRPVAEGLIQAEERGWCWQDTGNHFHVCSTLATLCICMHANQSARINLEDCEETHASLI